MSKINLTKERRSDMLCGALEGGSNYWYSLEKPASDLIYKYGEKEDLTLVDRMIEALYAGETIEIHDIEDDHKIGQINLASIDKGEELMFENSPSHYADLLSENDDAITADVWFQYCVLGEIIYG